MAITIDGTAGTIAGLVAGGLPSGSVTSATILDATIANGDVNDLAASKLTGALPAISGASLTNLPAGGKILQVVRGLGTSSLATTSASYVDVGVDVDITPASTSNSLLIFVDAWHNSAGGGTDVGCQLNLTKDSSGTPSHNIALYVTEDQLMTNINMVYMEQASSTSSQNWKLEVKTYGGGTTTIGGAAPWSPASITIMEIAG
jgi:hypothetical protein